MISYSDTSGSSQATVYQAITDLPVTAVTGTIAYVEEVGLFYLNTNNGWYQVATTNTSPIAITGLEAEYTQADPFSITLVSSDPEDVPLTWTYEITAGTNNGTTITNEGPVYTFTPPTDDTTDEFTVTFTASDGINEVQAAANFICGFLLQPGQQEFSASGTFTVPDGVTSINIAGIGSGGRSTHKGYTNNIIFWRLPNTYVQPQQPLYFAGGGGALAYSNDVTVTPGETLNIVAGDGNHAEVYRGSTLLFKAARGQELERDFTITADPGVTVGGVPSSWIAGWHGSYYGENDLNYNSEVCHGGQASDCVADVAYSGGNGKLDGRGTGGRGTQQMYKAGGGGAAGWYEDGKPGGTYSTVGTYTPSGGWSGNGGGGYVSVGGGGNGFNSIAGPASTGSDGEGVSGGESSSDRPIGTYSIHYNGGNYGGGGGSSSDGNGTGTYGNGLGSGAGIKIIWGTDRAWPETNVGDV